VSDLSQDLERRYGQPCMHSAQDWYIEDPGGQVGCRDCDSNAKFNAQTMTKIWVQAWRNDHGGEAPSLHLEREDIDRYGPRYVAADTELGDSAVGDCPYGLPFEIEFDSQDPRVQALMLDLLEEEPQYGIRSHQLLPQR
jgi:hypothetical protein